MQKFVVAIIHLKEPTGLCRSCCRSLGVYFKGNTSPLSIQGKARKMEMTWGNREN